MSGRRYQRTYEIVDDYDEDDLYEARPKREASPKKKEKRAKGQVKAEAKRGGSRVLLFVETVLLVAAVAYCAFVVMKFNRIQVESEIVNAENTKLSEQLEATGPMAGEAEFSTYVLTVWEAAAEVVPDGANMDVTVRATVYNDSLLELGNENVPDLICGGFHFKGFVEGEEPIPMFHGQGSIVWRAEDIPADTQGFALSFDDTHLVYYAERVSGAIEAKRAEAFGWA